ncbi:ABC-three component system middle component 2 [Qipengyuania sp. RANM35]|uniref:ABC-three component system middle component 2 n=1 Tax=Qipengyuania sp. RANM35 TaxID=3068635 RepID=UPI0034DB0C42
MSQTVSPFNSPLETGVRALSILEAAHPDSCDLQKLIELDYLVVHSGDVGGPASLHAALPMRAGELLVRREIIEKGLLLMASRGLVERVAHPDGIHFRAGEAAAPYLEALTAPYLIELRARARWAVQAFGDKSSEAMRAITQRFFEKWTTEFQPRQLPGLGS